jgi:hypothetical protein
MNSASKEYINKSANKRAQLIPMDIPTGRFDYQKLQKYCQ